jgi:aminoglycoside 3-N-acetyltransferase
MEAQLADQAAPDAAVTDPPVTRTQLVDDLRALGVTAGQTILVHASLSALGWVDGGAKTVAAALHDAVGPTGNLVVSTGTAENSYTSRAFLENVKDFNRAQMVGFRGRMPPFDVNSTPTSAGVIAEAIRTTPGAVRSHHPQSSFAAIGPLAVILMAGHQFDCHLGERSPLRQLYEREAAVLMLGVTYRACSALHLAEYRYAADPPRMTYSCVVETRGKRRWMTYRDVVLDDTEFETIGQSLDKELPMRRGFVGGAESRLMSLCDVVDFAAQWMADHRS